MMIATQNQQTLQEALDWSLMSLRQSRDYMQTVQLTRRDQMGLFLDSRYEDALKALDDAIERIECSRCPHAATGELSIGPVCDRCAAEFTLCAGCGNDVRLEDAYEDGDRKFHVECAPFESSRYLDAVSGQ